MFSVSVVSVEDLLRLNQLLGRYFDQFDGLTLSLFSVSSLLLIISSLRCSGILDPCKPWLLSVEP